MISLTSYRLIYAKRELNQTLTNMTNSILHVTKESSENLFEIKLDNVKNLSHILKVLNFKDVSNPDTLLKYRPTVWSR